MKRREFISNTCLTCIAVGISSSFLQGCSSVKTVNSFVEDGFLPVDKSEFYTSEGKSIQRIVVTSNSLKMPLVVFRLDENNYKSYSMECPHKGTEVKLYDNRMKCPAHGSTFNFKGEVLNGPAEENLEEYLVYNETEIIKIKLK